MSAARHRTDSIEGLEVFVREAGDPDLPGHFVLEEEADTVGELAGKLMRSAFGG